MSSSAHAGAGEHKPRLIFWEVTKGCNLRCVHCRATATELASPTDLPTERALDIINQIADFANPILVLSGGEPLYRRGHLSARPLRHRPRPARGAGHQRHPGDQEVAQKIVDCGVKRVSISLDGSDAQTHDTFRGIPGAFDAAIYGFRNLKELGMPVQINMTIARHNAAQLPARCWTWCANSAPTRCTPSCWCPSAAAWTSPRSRWCRPRSTSAS